MTSHPPDAVRRESRTPSRVDGTTCDDVTSGSIRQTAASIWPEEHFMTHTGHIIGVNNSSY